MSELAATQIPKPSDEQAFERCNEVLWRCILRDDSVQLHGRRGQRQNGVDMFGYRDDALDRIVGIQCKLKGEGQQLEEREVREEVRKALTFRPHLSEYIIVTTAPDDTKIQALALKLSDRVSKGRAKNLKIKVFGWGSLEREIRRYPEASNAFDPSYTPWGSQTEQKVERLPDEIVASLEPKFAAILAEVRTTQTINPVVDDTTIQTEWDCQISDYAEIIHDQPEVALGLFQKLLERLDDNVLDPIRYRVIANIAVCQLELGEEETAAQGFIEAYNLAHDDSKATANKAFGLLLQKNWSGLRAFAESRLSAYSDNAVLSACYIHSLIVDETITDPLVQVSKAVRGTPDVAEAHVRWLMARGTPEIWWDAAIAAHNAHPDNVGLKELYACALLERVTDGGKNQTISKAGRSEIQAVVEIYEARWLEIRNCSHNLRSESRSIPINLMSAYRLLDQGEKAVQIGTQALKRFPDSPKIREYLAVALAECGETDRALDMVSEFQINTQTAMIHYNIAVANEDWHAVSALVDEHLEVFSEEERPLAHATGIVARVELAPEKDRRSILEKEKDNFKDDARALARFARCACKHGFEDLASTYLTAAQAAIGHEGNRLVDRAPVAYEAMLQNKLGIAADVLVGHVPLDSYSEELRLLAHALVGDYPIRERAIRFFDDLSSEIRDLPPFQRLEGVLHINRGVPKDAIGPLSAAFQQDSSIENIMLLINALYRIGDRSVIETLLRQDGVDELSGHPSSRINFCHVLISFGKDVRALNLGYQALIQGLEDVGVVKRFLGLILEFIQNRSEENFDGVVAPGVWVRLTQSQGETSELLLDEETDRPWGAKGDSSNAFIAKALGQRVGDVFEHVNPVTGVTETWTVAQVKPRWLQAFHYLSRTFNQRFPDVRGFGRVTMAEDDIEPVLELVRRHSEEVNAQAELYFANNIPIAFVAGDRPGGSIAFAQHLAAIGKDVRTCSGMETERTEALTLIEQNNCAGAVLDALTAWHAAILGIFPIISEYLGVLAIPSSELLRLKALIDYYETLADKETMSLAYKDGQYIRHIATAEECTQQLARAQWYIESIEEACNVEPLVVPDSLSELGEVLLKDPFHDAVAPAIIAGHSRLLLSEDMMMRQLVAAAYGTKGVWIQVVALRAAQMGKISPDTYADMLVHFAAHRHGHVAISADVLFSVYERDTSDELIRLQALCIYLGNKNAEPVSHITAAANFVNKIWVKNSSSDLKVRTATDLIFKALLLQGRKHERAKWAASLYPKLAEGPRCYLWEWCEAHSFSIENVKQVLRQTESSEIGNE